MFDQNTPVLLTKSVKDHSNKISHSRNLDLESKGQDHGRNQKPMPLGALN